MAHNSQNQASYCTGINQSRCLRMSSLIWIFQTPTDSPGSSSPLHPAALALAFSHFSYPKAWHKMLTHQRSKAKIEKERRWLWRSTRPMKATSKQMGTLVFENWHLLWVQSFRLGIWVILAETEIHLEIIRREALFSFLILLNELKFCETGSFYIWF